ncbi:hypothetical protein JKG47_15965 [Acidithiobacillus sp. MC6.1]|nr:hypothetical protein [Acidithiobacillus sp. MC6.1]
MKQVFSVEKIAIDMGISQTSVKARIRRHLNTSLENDHYSGIAAVLDYAEVQMLGLTELSEAQRRQIMKECA